MEPMFTENFCVRIHRRPKSKVFKHDMVTLVLDESSLTKSYLTESYFSLTKPSPPYAMDQHRVHARFRYDYNFPIQNFYC